MNSLMMSTVGSHSKITMSTTSGKVSCELHKQRPCLLFVGSPLLDITAPCDAETLKRYSLKADDCVLASRQHDALFQTLFGDPKSRVDAGGSALNSAKIAQWVLGRRGHCAFAGCVGEDEYASRLFDDLQSSGVEPLLITFPEKPTGICACLLSKDGKRSMCTRQGAAALFTEDHLDEGAIKTNLDNADCIFVVGYFVSHSLPVVRALADRCSPYQLFALSLSAEYICKEFTAALLDILPRVDILFGNENEIRSFAVSAGMGENLTTEYAASAIAKLKQAHTRRPRIVVVTRGPDSVILARGSEPVRHFPVPHDVPVVDSVGCGDALAGAILASYILTGNVDAALEVGIWAAVRIVQVPGCELPPQDTELPETFVTM